MNEATREKLIVEMSQICYKHADDANMTKQYEELADLFQTYLTQDHERIATALRKEKWEDDGDKYCGCDGECFAACPKSHNIGISTALALVEGTEKNNT